MVFISRVLSSLVLCALLLCVASPAFPAGPAPGSLIAQSPIEGAPDGALAWRIRYHSLAQDGTPVEVTGVVIAPAGPAPKGGRDVVGWAHGTVGIAESCAPSNLPKLFENIGGLTALLAKGYVVAATDYQGLGTPGPAPFLVGVSSGRSVLDSVRAARAIPQAAASDKVVFWGESQGAHAVLWAAQIASRYAPELHVLGAVAAAPPTDLVENFKKTIDIPAHALLTAFTTQAYANIYGIKLSTFSNGVGQNLIHRLAKDCMHVNTLDGVANVGMLLLSNQVPSHVSPEWGRLLRENTPQLIGPKSVPIMMVQGSKDVVLVPQVARDFATRSCQGGGSVDFINLEDATHTDIIARSVDVTIPWIADRFAGRAVPPDCAGL